MLMLPLFIDSYLGRTLPVCLGRCSIILAFDDDGINPRLRHSVALFLANLTSLLVARS